MAENRHYPVLISVFLLLLSIGISSITVVWAGGGSHNVVVVINKNSAASREIGKYYQSARGIRDSNICWLNCPDQELVSSDICEKQIRAPLYQFLNSSDITGMVDYIVLTKGIPLAADYGDPEGPYSTASILMCVGNPEIKEPLASPYGPCAAYSWQSGAPEVAWSHSLDFQGYHFYLVTRLDAFTVDQAKAMIDRAVNPVHCGRFILDRNTWLTGSYKNANARLGDQEGSAYAELIDSGANVDFDPGEEFLSNEENLMGYFSWSCLDEKYSFSKYTSNTFVSGSIGDTYYSFSGRTFNDPGTIDRRPLMADLIANGLTGAGAYVSEPYITTATYANILFDRYLKGYNMAESFYAACPEMFWKTVIIGDPLMAPYATPPDVSLSPIDDILSGTQNIQAYASDDSGISQVKFYFDDKLISTCTTPPYTLSLDTTHYQNGSHKIEAVAYEASNVATQGSAAMIVTVGNDFSFIPTIGTAAFYPNESGIMMDNKVVISGTAETGDGFYIEESDRSSAIKVIGGDVVCRGNVVTVSGTLNTVGGERAIIDPKVTVTSNNGTIPSPLMLRLRDLGGAAVTADTIPVGNGIGARNTGLLVKVTGRVTASDYGKFYITDGSTSSPVKIVCSNISGPDVDKFVSVIGISTFDYNLPCGEPSVTARSADDIVVFQ